MALFYVAHRLFAAHDRAVGAYIASRLARKTDVDSVFLPFCDTDEENLVSDCKGRHLFELDRARLHRITGMIAVLHGPSLDDGVCMEIGFAAAKGVPVVLVSTDFQTYAAAPGGPSLSFPEPLLEHVAASVVRAHRLGPPARQVGGDPYRAFLSQNISPLRAAADQAVAVMLGVAREGSSIPLARMERGKVAYVEPSPYLADHMWDDVTAVLRGRGWQVHVAERFLAGHSAIQAARTDWTAAMTACLAIVDTRGPETPPGAALMTGACTATGRPVLAAHSGTWQTLADGREPNWRNLMIQYGVTGRFASITEFTAALDALQCAPS